jgi:hypothetical protein
MSFEAVFAFLATAVKPFLWVWKGIDEDRNLVEAVSALYLVHCAAQEAIG